MPTIMPNLGLTSPLLERIFAARGITTASTLENQLSALLPFSELKDIHLATARIEQALRAQEHIMIIGDFDADGATSTALAVSALKAMGAQHVSFLVPNRFVFGYGLTPPLVDLAKETDPKLIITVDNGISSIEGVSHARALNIDVLITDHHLAGESLPEACAIVNPNQPGDLFLSKALAGVGVIFYVMLALRRHLQDAGWFEQEKLEVPNMAQFLDLVALGTFADVVPLDQNNRILVHQGMKRIQQGLARPGIQALIEIAGRVQKSLRPADLGYAIAPRLNAAGRLDDMSLGISCLLSESYAIAKPLVVQLDALNDERRLIEHDMKIQAFAALDSLKTQLKEEDLPAGLCLMDPTWHQGVIGILAGRLKEVYHRPVIVFAQVSETEMKGSARSVSELNIRDVLAQINQDNPGLITKFGGHAMAAGISFNPDSFLKFKQCFAEEVAKHLPIERCKGEIWTDGPLASHELTLDTARLLEEAGPWGSQFPDPVFEGEFHIIQQRIVGQKHLKLTLKPLDGEQYIDAIAFNVNLNHWPNHRARSLYAVYTLDLNVYQQITRLQLIVQFLEAVQVPVEMMSEV
jgi:single-stranded-DNA-specific exonuclease